MAVFFGENHSAHGIRGAARSRGSLLDLDNSMRFFYGRCEMEKQEKSIKPEERLEALICAFYGMRSSIWGTWGESDRENAEFVLHDLAYRIDEQISSAKEIQEFFDGPEYARLYTTDSRLKLLRQVEAYPFKMVLFRVRCGDAYAVYGEQARLAANCRAGSLENIGEKEDPLAVYYFPREELDEFRVNVGVMGYGVVVFEVDGEDPVEVFECYNVLPSGSSAPEEAANG